MKYTFEKAKKSTVKINIDLTAKEWKEAIESAYNKTKGKYSVPGFRKGKVPQKVLESVYGQGVFYEEAINQAFPKYYTEILEKEPTIDAVATPDLDIKKISEKGISMVAIVAVKPEVVLGAYKGINYKKNVYNVKDEDVEADIKRLQERNSRLVDVTDRAATDDGNSDLIHVDTSGDYRDRTISRMFLATMLMSSSVELMLIPVPAPRPLSTTPTEMLTARSRMSSVTGSMCFSYLRSS